MSYSDNVLVCTASMPQAAQVSLICSSPFATSISRRRTSFWQEGQIQIGGGDDGSGWRGRGMTAAVSADGDHEGCAGLTRDASHLFLPARGTFPGRGDYAFSPRVLRETRN